ncbi:MAG: Na/Pi cotransporter family protein [Ruminiclostridium sp.]|nr:Na/Pi cotransporter family protein [Ruminiclostridium sp.]
MTIFDVLTLIGGLCLFLFGMNVMGNALERRAGGKLRAILGKLTQNKATGFLTGLGVTSIIQSSSATTVMVVGFVNSGLMTLRQAINVIMGANVGTTVTAWILSLGGIESDNVFVQLLKPSSFTPVLALIGIILYMFVKDEKKNDIGTIFLGFATLMFGMDTMSAAVAGLRDVPEFAELFVLFTNPILGVLAGAILTAIIQSSSASVGILQALSVTGKVTFGSAIPIIMGQNIGTCITAILSSVGTNKNAKRAALVHLSFNIIGTVILLTVFCIIKALVHIPLLEESATHMGIAVAHSAFNILCTAILLPMAGILEKLAMKLIPETKKPEKNAELDERLLATPPIALKQCGDVVGEMAAISIDALKKSIAALKNYDETLAEEIRYLENRSDHYEDILSAYLVKLSSHQVSEQDSLESAKLLKMIGDFERISDHSVNIVESAEEMKEKGLEFTKSAKKEIDVLCSAVTEILELTYKAYAEGDLEAALLVEPLEQVIDGLKEKMRTQHILRLQQGECSIVAGFVWSDLLNNLERTSDHCSNIAGCVIEAANNELTVHEALRDIRSDSPDYWDKYKNYLEKYSF